MRRLAACVVVLAVLVGLTRQSAHAEITAKEVRESIERGVEYLKRQQRANGSWPDWFGYDGGVTAVCALALLNSGVEPDDPSIQRALEHLRKVPPTKTYVTSLQTMVFCRADPERDEHLIRRNVGWLQKNQIHNGPNTGAWAYPEGGGDNSNSQFALLALHEAERTLLALRDTERGTPFNRSTWRLAKAHWERCQNPDGSWGYTLGAGGSGSMTCAGITSLVIANDKIDEGDARVQGNRILCCQPSETRDEPVERGLRWLAESFSVTRNPGGRGQVWYLYYMYGLERVGRLTNRRLIGEHDWYREGADHLIKMKGGPLSDHWTGQNFEGNNACLSTGFALLFLSKGRWPVLMSKLKYGRGDDWNRHRNDAGNLTRYVEMRWKRDLIWQLIELPAAAIDDLVQSPVLYLCGANSPLPADAADQEELAKKLRGYLDRGGFLLAEGHCPGTDFDGGFRKLMERVFPEKEYRLRLLDPEHPIWRAEEPVPPDQIRPLLGIEFGCRTSVVYCPPDKGRAPLSCLWELSRPGRDKEFPQVVKKQVDAGLSLGINILAYATNRELQFKDAFLVKASAAGQKDDLEQGKLYVPSLLHPGGCSAAPRALTNLLQAAANELKLRVHAETRELNIADPALFDYHLVFMHGRRAFELTDAERKQLRTFLQRGGVIFANAICASPEFTKSFRREMQAILPEEPLKAIPRNDPLFTPVYGGFDLSKVTRRDPQGGGRNQPIRQVLSKGPPDLEGIKLGVRYAVVFSPYDLSCALEKQDSMECRGYVREDAARIGLNVVLYALQQ